MKIIRSIREMREISLEAKCAQKTVGFVPTMGALHEGHLSLIKCAKEHTDSVVASIFVNPAQFAPHEDFDRYPRTEQHDIDALESQQADIVFIPDAKEIYPNGTEESIRIRTGDVGQILEGVSRPHFFDGVALVVAKLFNIVSPDIAVFGEKDFQQLHIIKRLVRELHFPINVIGAPLIREKDGLAMSSRNVRLTAEDRKTAPCLYQSLCQISEDIKTHKDIDAALEKGKQRLASQKSMTVDYIELRNRETLAKATSLEEPLQLLGAAILGDVRLIDNIPVNL